jgi:mRNA deadenylase 3'-5' endonuclease subunit Ccr4
MCEDQNKIVREVKSPSAAEVGFPNSKWPSDHLPVGAIFQIK